jgi:hypothetical protein
VTRGQATSIKSSVRCSPEGPQTTTTQSDKLPSYLQSFTHIRPARPSKGSSELGSDVSGQNPKHLEASRSIFSSQCMQNRHQALKPMQNLYFFKRQHAVSLDTNRFGGAERDRTADPLLAKQVLSQLRYSPICSIAPFFNVGSGTSASPYFPGSPSHSP